MPTSTASVAAFETNGGREPERERLFLSNPPQDHLPTMTVKDTEVSESGGDGKQQSENKVTITAPPATNHLKGPLPVAATVSCTCKSKGQIHGVHSLLQKTPSFYYETFEEFFFFFGRTFP